MSGLSLREARTKRQKAKIYKTSRSEFRSSLNSQNQSAADADNESKRRRTMDVDVEPSNETPMEVTSDSKVTKEEKVKGVVEGNSDEKDEEENNGDENVSAKDKKLKWRGQKDDMDDDDSSDDNSDSKKTDTESSEDSKDDEDDDEDEDEDSQDENEKIGNNEDVNNSTHPDQGNTNNARAENREQAVVQNGSGIETEDDASPGIHNGTAERDLDPYEYFVDFDDEIEDNHSMDDPYEFLDQDGGDDHDSENSF